MYLDFHHNELKTVAYFEYFDINSFRKFRFHFVFLFWYKHLTDRVFFKNSKFVFEFLANTSKKIWIMCLKKIFDELLIFHVENNTIDNLNTARNSKIQKNYLYIDILYHCFIEIEHFENWIKIFDEIINAFIHFEIIFLSEVFIFRYRIYFAVCIEISTKEKHIEKI